jgi:hypothetical protein
MSEVKKNCYSCSYRASVPGSCHSKCTFDFGKADIPTPVGNPHGIRSGWYMFPLNYDPVWMTEQCKAWSNELNPELVKKHDSFLELLSLLR